MATQQYCSTCGNPISDWAHGVCYSCGRMQYREPRKLWKASVRPERRKLFIPAEIGVTDWKKTAEKHVNGINALLKDVYGRDVRISQLMEQSGIPPSQIVAWRRRKSWVLSFLLRVEDELCILLERVRPDCNPHLLKDCYIERLSIEQIAKKCKQSKNEILEDQGFILEYLKSKRGITALERIIVKCTRFQP